MKIKLQAKVKKDIIPTDVEFNTEGVAVGKQLFLHQVGTERVYTTTKVTKATRMKNSVAVYTPSNRYVFSIL